MGRLTDCKHCTVKCPQEELACEIAKGRMYATDEVIKLQKELQRYKDLEEQGRLVLYPREAYFIRNKEVYKGWVQEVSYSICRKPLYDIRFDDYSLECYRGYLGNTVFLTKEEAEAKLKELEGVKE